MNHYVKDESFLDTWFGKVVATVCFLGLLYMSVLVLYGFCG